MNDIILAQVTGSGMGEWIMVLFAVAAGVLAILKIIDRNKPVPPLHNQFADKEKTEKEIEILHRRISDLRRENQEQFKALMQAGEERGRMLHERIIALPMQIIALLKETKGLI